MPATANEVRPPFNISNDPAGIEEYGQLKVKYHLAANQYRDSGTSLNRAVQDSATTVLSARTELSSIVRSMNSTLSTIEFPNFPGVFGAVASGAQQSIGVISRVASGRASIPTMRPVSSPKNGIVGEAGLGIAGILGLGAIIIYGIGQILQGGAPSISNPFPDIFNSDSDDSPPPPTPDGDRLIEEWNKLPPGDNPSTSRELPTEDDIQAWYDKHSEGATESGTTVTPKGTIHYKVFPDGTRIQLRDFSGSGGKTVDIDHPRLNGNRKIHIPSTPGAGNNEGGGASELQ